MGTPSYMSPEQILGLPVDGRSDLFSAGVILYQLLTGERPFSGSSTTTMQKVLKEDPLPPTTLNVQLPEAIDAVVRKALAKRPEDRYQTAAEFAADLRAAVGPRTASDSDPGATRERFAGDGTPRAGLDRSAAAVDSNATVLNASTRRGTADPAGAVVSARRCPRHRRPENRKRPRSRSWSGSRSLRWPPASGYS